MSGDQMRLGAQLTLGFVIAIGLLVAAVWLWLHNLIIFAAPVGALAIGAAWATVDNTLIYPAQRARRDAAAAQLAAAQAPQGLPADTTAPSEITAHQ